MIVRLLFALCSFFICLNASAQTKSKLPQYKGGLDSLNRYLYKHLSAFSDLNREYFMFVRIAIRDNGVITVNEIFNKQDSITMKIIGLIRNNSSSWIKVPETNPTVLLPIFLTAEKDSDKNFKMLYHTTTSQDYEKNAEPIEGLLLPPFVMFMAYYR